VSNRETEAARQIRILAREELGLEWNGADGDEIASRLDSLSTLSLLVAVEDHFRIRIGEEEAAGARSLSDLAQIVARKLAGGSSGEPEGEEDLR